LRRLMPAPTKNDRPTPTNVYNNQTDADRRFLGAPFQMTVMRDL
jgi:hypothetical protein